MAAACQQAGWLLPAAHWLAHVVSVPAPVVETPTWAGLDHLLPSAANEESIAELYACQAVAVVCNLPMLSAPFASFATLLRRRCVCGRKAREYDVCRALKPRDNRAAAS
jgi:hypothetical protein